MPTFDIHWYLVWRINIVYLVHNKSKTSQHQAQSCPRGPIFPEDMLREGALWRLSLLLRSSGCWWLFPNVLVIAKRFFETDQWKLSQLVPKDLSSGTAWTETPFHLPGLQGPPSSWFMVLLTWALSLSLYPLTILNLSVNWPQKRTCVYKLFFTTPKYLLPFLKTMGSFWKACRRVTWSFLLPAAEEMEFWWILRQWYALHFTPSLASFWPLFIPKGLFFLHGHTQDSWGHTNLTPSRFVPLGLWANSAN